MLEPVVNVWRAVRRSARASCVTAGVALSLAALSSCGGGSRIDPYQPNRILVWGDEISTLTSTGNNYAINGIQANATTVDCNMYPAWTQILASSFGMVFAQCNTGGVATPQATQFSAVNDHVADVVTKINSFFATDTLGPKDLAVIDVGMHDILDAYAQYPTVSSDALLAQMYAQGQALAGIINKIAAANGRVIFVTVHDLGLTPFAAAEQAAHNDIDRAAFLTQLTERFNAGIKIAVLNDGRYIGLVESDALVEGIYSNPAANGFVDRTTAVCTVAPPDCTSQTLVANTNATSYMWANSLLFSTAIHSRLGSIAVQRAHNNPF